MSRRATAAADLTRCATRSRARLGPLAGAVALAAIGVVLVPGAPSTLRAEPGNTNWVGKRVILKPGGILLTIEKRLIHPGRFDIYRVEKAEGLALRLRGEREGISGWASAAQVVPVSQAVKFFTDYIRANPNDPSGYTTRAIFLERENKELDRALADYNEVIRLDPTKAYGYNNRGKLWSAKKEFDRAIADYTEAIRRDPKDAVVYNNRGLAWKDKKEYDKAMADFEAAHRLDPAYVFPDFNRIYVLFAARRDGVVDAAKRFLESRGWGGSHSAYVAILGHLAALRSGETGRAKTFLEDAVLLCDRSTWPYPVVKYLGGEIDEAKMLAAATDDGKMTEARCYLGLKMIQEQRTESALAHLRWVVEHGDPSFLEYGVALAEFGRLTGR